MTLCKPIRSRFFHPAWVVGVLTLACGAWLPCPAAGQARVLDGGVHHLRNGSRPEWAGFEPRVEGGALTIHFEARPNTDEQALRLRQEDVKQDWHVQLNGQALGRLTQDEKAMDVYFSVAPGVIASGGNTLRIEQVDTTSDDIRVGRITLEARPPHHLLSEATVQIRVTDTDTGTQIPARLTVTDPGGILQPIGAASNEHLAVRTGFVYTGDGGAMFGLPAGDYVVYATRGFEYGVDSVHVRLEPGDRITRALHIRREVDTEGWISADTHIHTLTHSGHGDASDSERVLTIAGEGIELPILTDHNTANDIEKVAEAMHVRTYFSPVVGDEYTTRVGHFNLFPLNPSAPVPDPEVRDWEEVAEATGGDRRGGVVILNHAHDGYFGFHPFGIERHVEVSGTDLDGWAVPANAMEVINSGSQQTDMMQLFRDWFGMLNRGVFLTPAGGSDSHDVSRYLVGQSRTYIQADDRDPGDIDVSTAVEHFREGRVMVSLGLLTEINVNGGYGPGDLVPGSDSVRVAVRVLGPGWTRADHVSLYENGRKIREAEIQDDHTPGLKWAGSWTLPRPANDVFLVAIAEGPGDFTPFWQIAKPYQHTSPEWTPHVMGSTGAVWIDADDDGQRTSAYEYASRLVAASKGNVRDLLEQLSSYDEAVAMEAAAQLQMAGLNLVESEVSSALVHAVPVVQRGFQAFTEGWTASQLARHAR